MRLFVALDVPQTVKDKIERDVVETLGDSVEGARWTRPEGRHLTLAFLGDVADERTSGVVAALAQAARRHEAFAAAFAEVGGFPNARRPRVLWLGIGDGRDQMTALAESVTDALEPLGFPKEKRPFHPHFTLARFPAPRVIDDLPSVDVPEDRFTVDELTLFRSQLHPKGARYSVIESVKLRS
jgi:RNA 2',3'-cyclic 3'-phosphodiesterase